jgi:hypothetical protein
MVVTTIPLKRPLNPEEVARLGRELPPLAAGRPGYRGLYWGLAEPTEALTVSVWDSLVEADASFEAIAPWIREVLGPVLAGPPQRRAAEVLVAHQAAGDRTGGSRG